MFDPIEILRRLPWRNMMAAGGSAVVAAMFLDLLLGTMILNTPSIAPILLPILLREQVGFIMPLIFSTAIGVLALYLLETRFPPSRIELPVLWGLIFCIMMCLLGFWAVGNIISLLNISSPIHGLGWVGANQLEVVATAIGALWYGRQYWR